MGVQLKWLKCAKAQRSCSRVAGCATKGSSISGRSRCTAAICRVTCDGFFDLRVNGALATLVQDSTITADNVWST